ncbi:ABC transporter permease [Nocardioides sp. Bht2]|uniref:ABC transporter permease n=1 Tax=Nocardioides sp. Bht2 TaxID=3392297 RepID=UPI0039B3B451
MPEHKSRSSWRILVRVLQVCVGLGALACGVAEIGVIDGPAMILAVVAGLWLLTQGVVGLVELGTGRAIDTAAWLAASWMILVLGVVLLADALPLGEHIDTAATIDDSAGRPVDLLSAHPLGTNSYALDTLAQVIHGARVSLSIALFAVVVSVVVGGIVGTAAGYYRGWPDTMTSVATDAVISIPPLILLIALAAAFGPPETTLEAVLKTGAALGAVTTPAVIRLARASAMSISKRDYVLAMKAVGARPRWLILREVLPGVAVPVLSYAFLLVAMLIIAEGSLSFLGLGLQPPQPTWGNMIAEADVSKLRTSPHLALVPGTCMFLTVYALNVLGERAQSRWDPREAKV